MTETEIGKGKIATEIETGVEIELVRIVPTMVAIVLRLAVFHQGMVSNSLIKFICILYAVCDHFSNCCCLLHC